MSLFHFKNTLVRELAWVMCSPNLLVPAIRRERGKDNIPLVWDADCRRYYQRFLNRLQALDQAPEPLQAWMAQLNSPRLGIRFEHYLEYWLRWVAPKKDDVIRGLTLMDSANDKRTLGQLDFLWRDSRGMTQHWEAAVKYYIYWPHQAEINGDKFGAVEWLGPNANDSFEAKLSHLQQQQMPRASRLEAQQALRARAWDVEVHSALFLKGYLFYPLAEDGTETDTWRLGGETRVVAPVSDSVCRQRLSQAHLKGWWQRFPYRRLARVSPHSRWLVLPKTYWLAPFAADSEAALAKMGLALLNDKQLLEVCEQHFAASSRALMLVEMMDNGRYLHEISRAMLLDEHWPNLKNSGKTSI